MTRTLGPYELRSELGRGAMAVVWRAYDPVLDREVALKEAVVSHGTDAATAGELATRFVREARAAARLSHPGIVTVYAADVYEGRPVIAMELIRGATLGQMLRRGRLSPQVVLGHFDQLLEAVAYAHDQGIVHRDIKPDNIFITTDGRVKLGDFGVAHLGGGTALTQAGTIMGTPGYMAPEQIRGEAVDARADIFALGVVLHEMLTGANPFGADAQTSITTVIFRIIQEPAPPLPPSVTAAFAHDIRPALAAALAKDPRERFADARSFMSALRGEGPLPTPGAYVAPLWDARDATMMGRSAMLKQKTMIGPSAGPTAAPSWLRSWLPYAAVVGVGFIVMIALLVVAKAGGGGTGATLLAPSNGEATVSTEASLYLQDPGDNVVKIRFGTEEVVGDEVGLHFQDLGGNVVKITDVPAPGFQFPVSTEGDFAVVVEAVDAYGNSLGNLETANGELSYASVADRVAKIVVKTYDGLVYWYMVPQAQGSTTYTDPALGYSFDYPSGWQLDSTAVQSTSGAAAVGRVSVFDPAGTRAGSSYIDLLHVSVYQLNAAVDESMMAGVRPEVEQVVAGLQSQGNDTQVVEALSQTTAAGMPGFKTTLTFVTDGVPVTSTMYVLFSGEKEYQLTLQAATENWQAKLPTLEAILSSFRPGAAN